MTQATDSPAALAARSRNRTLLRRGAYTLGAIVILLGLLPPAIGLGLTLVLERLSGGSASVERISLDLLTPRLSLSGLELNLAGAQPLKVGKLELTLAGWPWRERHVEIDSLRLSDFSVAVEQFPDSLLRIAGIPLPPAGTSTPAPAATTPGGAAADTVKQWSFGLNKVQLDNGRLLALLPKLSSEWAINHLQFGPLDTRRPEANTHLQLLSSLDGAALKVDADLTPLAKKPLVAARIVLTALDTSHYQPLAQPYLSRLAGKLSIDTELLIGSDDNQILEITQNGAVAIENLQLRQADRQFTSSYVGIDGTASSLLDHTTGKVKAEHRGSLRINGLTLAHPLAVIENNTLQWRGTTRLPTTTTPQIKGELKLEGLRIVPPDEPFEPLSLAALHMEGLELSGPTTATLQALKLDGLVIRLQRNEDGTLRFIDSVLTRREKTTDTTTTEAATTTTPTDQETAPPTSLSIGTVTIGGNSRIEVDDRGVQPAFRQTLYIDSIELGDLDSSQPDQQSPLSLATRLDEFSQLTAEGWVKPFARRPTLAMKGKLTALELPPVSPYASGTLGYYISSGQLNSELTMKMEQGVMDGETKLLISNLDLEAAKKGKKGGLDQHLDVPLETALSLLKDKQNNIKLNVPIKGDINKPEFNLNDVINKAIGNATRKVFMSYLKQTLQPFGTMLTLMEMGGKLAGGVRLDPVFHQAGTTQHETLGSDYFTALATLMNERPQLRLRLCSRATESDRQALAEIALQQLREKSKGKKETLPMPQIADDALQQLATERATQIKAILVRQHAIAAERLFVCHPEIDSKAEAKPRTEILI